MQKNIILCDCCGQEIRHELPMQYHKMFLKDMNYSAVYKDFIQCNTEDSDEWDLCDSCYNKILDFIINSGGESFAKRRPGRSLTAKRLMKMLEEEKQ